jgi:hypothetical protein
VPVIAPSPEVDPPPAPEPTAISLAPAPSDPATIASDIAISFEIHEEQREEEEQERQERYQKSLSGLTGSSLGALGALGSSGGGLGIGGGGLGGGSLGGGGLAGLGGGGRGYGKGAPPPRKRATVTVAVASVASPRSQADVRGLLRKHQHRIATCHERHGKGRDWTASLRFVVEPGGQLGQVRVTGAGPEPARSCIADLLSRLTVKGSKNGKSRVEASLDLAGP